MYTQVKIFLNKAPFVKLLVPLATGIAVQKYYGPPLLFSIILFCIALAILFVFPFFPQFRRLSISGLKTVCLLLAMTAAGMLLFAAKDLKYNKKWFGHYYSGKETLAVTLLEDPVQKENSFKAEAEVSSVINIKKFYKTNGRIIIYFKKDARAEAVASGSQIAFDKPIQEIKNSGNPGTFDYKEYALFNGITHTIYLTESDYILSAEKYNQPFNRVLVGIRQYVLQTIRNFIPGKKEQGLAEALLIGYKDDLDRDLLQSYTNTGVVHVIAVSGMHLALIFWLLNLLFRPLLKSKRTAWLHPVLIIMILWLFTLIAGGSASIVRAAVMFSFILAGTAFGRKASMYNTLAASAFALLCYNPYWLWDAGFQLSYAAVLSIIIFYKPIYHLMFTNNKLLDGAWQLLAVSIAAQILTTPIVLYQFHQFPVYFLITNLLIVPVSSLVLIGELMLVLISPLTFLAAFLGKLLSASIWWMNSFIEGLEKFPYAIIDGIFINRYQVILLFNMIASAAFFFFSNRKTSLYHSQRKKGFWVGLLALMVFLLINAGSFYKADHQRKMIVYNISKHDAIDFIDGRNFVSLSDSSLQQNKRLVDMNQKPSRTLHRVKPAPSLPGLAINENSISFSGKRILIINAPVNTNFQGNKTKVDYVLLSGNPRLYISDLVKVIDPGQIIISGSAPRWKAAYWQKDCDSLKIRCHDVAEKGAFVMTLR